MPEANLWKVLFVFLKDLKLVNTKIDQDVLLVTLNIDLSFRLLKFEEKAELVSDWAFVDVGVWELDFQEVYLKS